MRYGTKPGGESTEPGKEFVGVAIPEANIDLMLEDFSTTFRSEQEWKDTLESKGSALLGFVSLFVGVLLSVTSLAMNLDNFPVIAVPLTLQVLASLILLYVSAGYVMAVGSKLSSALSKANESPERFKNLLAMMYAKGVMTNRIAFAGRLTWFREAVLLVWASVLQLGINFLIRAGNQPVPVGVLWAPGAVAATIGSGIVTWGYCKDSRSLRQDLSKWNELIRRKGGADGQ